METPEQSEARKDHGTFVREATGLVKNVSFFDAIAINISYMSIGAALALIGFTMEALPTISGVNLVYGSGIAALLTVPQMVVYTLMMRRASRTGGDYVWLSRSLHGFLGSTITFTGITLETMPYLALIALSVVFAIGSVGLSLGNNGLMGLALPGYLPGSNPSLQFLIASITFALLIAVNILKPRLGFKVISAFWTLGIFALLVSVLTLLSAGREGVVEYVNSLSIPNISYSSVTSSYKGSNTFDLGATLLIMPFFALFSYPWFNAAPSVGSELKGSRTIRWNVPVSLIAAFLLLTIPFATMYYTAGLPFTNAALANKTLVEEYSFNFWTLSMGVTHNLALKLIIGLGWILFTLATLAFGIITISRYLLAQSFDRFLPSWLAYVSPKYRSPVIAHLLDLVITVALIGLASFLYGTISSLYGAVVASMVYFAIVGVAALVYALRREKGSSKLILSIAGVFQALVFLYLTYEFLAYPEIWGGNVLAYGYIILTLLAGSTIYLVSKKLHQKKGIDITLAFKQIPPE